MGFMDLFSSKKQKRKILYFRDDYKFTLMDVPVEDDILVKYEGDKRKEAWLLLHQLLLPLTGLGLKGNLVSMVSTRDIRIDPLDLLGDEWSDKNIRTKTTQMAKEEQHKAIGQKRRTIMSVATIWLSVAAFLLILGIVLMGLMKYYVGLKG